MIRRPPRSTLSSSSAASDVYKRRETGHRLNTSRHRSVTSRRPGWARAVDCRPGPGASGVVGGGDGSQPGRAGLLTALECGPVHLDQPEGRTVPEHPLEIVQQAPVEVPPDVDAVVEAALESGQGPGHVLDPRRVVLSADAVLGDVD